MRVGMGYDVHRLVEGRKLILGGVEIPYEFAPRRAGDLPVCYAEVTKAKEQLGFVTGKTIEQCCEDSYRWQKRNPQGYQES